MKLKRLIALPALSMLLLFFLQLLGACGVQTESGPAAVTVTPVQAGAAVAANTILPISAASSQTNPSLSATTPQPTATSSRVSFSFDEPRKVADLRELVAMSSVIVIGKVSSMGEIVNYSRDTSDISKPDPTQFALGQVYHVEVESYLKGQGGSNVDLVAQEGRILGPEMHKTPLDFEKAKAEDHHIPLVIGTRYLIFLKPSFFTPYYDVYKEDWGYKLPINGNAEIQSPNLQSQTLFPAKPSGDLVTEIKEIIRQNPTVAATTAVVALPTPTPNIVAKQMVNLVKLYKLDTAQSLSISGILIHEANRDQFFNSGVDSKPVIASLNQDVTILDNSSAADLSHEVMFITFRFANGNHVGFSYNIKTGLMSVLLPDNANWIRVVAPAQLLHATGLDSLGGSAPTLPALTTTTVGVISSASSVEGTGSNSASKGSGGITAIKPHQNAANASTDTNVATFTEADVRQFLNTHPSLGLIKSNSPFVVEKVEFLSSREVSKKLTTSVANIVGATDDKLLCLVTLRGSFVMAASPPVPGQTVGPAKTFTHAFQVFDAQTGNLILLGGLPD